MSKRMREGGCAPAGNVNTCFRKSSDKVSTHRAYSSPPSRNNCNNSAFVRGFASSAATSPKNFMASKPSIELTFPSMSWKRGTMAMCASVCATVRLTGAAGGVVRLDRGDGGGRQLLARYGRQPRDDADTIRVPLTVHRPYSGELELDAAPTGYAQPLATIVAERFSLHLENDRLRRTDLRRQTWLTFLAEASELLAQSLDVELTLALIPQLVVPRLGPWAAIYGLDEWNEPVYATAAHTDETALPALVAGLSRTGPDGATARL